LHRSRPYQHPDQIDLTPLVAPLAGSLPVLGHAPLPDRHAVVRFPKV
jgi:hypothetical protein